MNLENTRNAFKAYDIRGKVPEELNEILSYNIGRAFVQLFKAKTVVIGRDIRLSGELIAKALAEGLIDAGADVIDIGLCGTEMIYFATDFWQADGGIMITASHNPKEYNGMKFVKKHSRPISSDNGLLDIADIAIKGDFLHPFKKGTFYKKSIMQDYIRKLLTYIDIKKLKPLKIVVNAGNGCAGETIDELEKILPFEFIKINHNPDGTFPNGVPNPILLDNRQVTSDKVIKENADLGIAWDGDFDRCFFFDHKGSFIEGYYIVGLLAEAFLNKYEGAKIIHDPRLIWNTLDIINKYKGQAVECKSGHAFIKEKMRQVDAIYGGEMSSHHYFKDFAYCDSGMIPWLLITEMMCVSGKSLTAFYNEMQSKFPCSGEINRRVENEEEVMEKIKIKYNNIGNMSEIDGISFEFCDWRFNVRASNTEPVVRLNVETRGNVELLDEKTKEVLSIIGGNPA